MKAVLSRALVVSVLFVSACSREEEQGPPQTPAADARLVEARHLAQQRVDFKTSLDERLASIDARLDDVRRRRSDPSFDPQLTQLSGLRADLDAAASRFNAAGEMGWQEAAADFDKQYTYLSDQLDKERVDYKASVAQRAANLDSKVDDARSRHGGPAAEMMLAPLLQKRRDLDLAAQRVQGADDEQWREATASFEKLYQEVSASLSQERADYVAAIKLRVSELGQRVDKALTKPTVKASKKTTAELDEMRRDVANAADRVTNATEISWKDASADFEQKYRALNDRIDKELGKQP